MGSAVGDQKQSGTGESEGGSVKRKISVAATAGEDHMSSDSENEKEEEEEEEEEEERERASRAEGEEGRGEGQDGEHDDEGRYVKSKCRTNPSIFRALQVQRPWHTDEAKIGMNGCCGYISRLSILMSASS